MPEIGAKKLAGDFKSMMADVCKAIEESKGTVAAAANELKTEITDGAKAAAKAIRQEAATVRAGYAELLGNAPPETATDSKGESKQGESGLPKAGPIAAPAATPSPGHAMDVPRKFGA